jgi:bile acid:Na+ symporter, BASS family
MFPPRLRAQSYELRSTFFNYLRQWDPPGKIYPNQPQMADYHYIDILVNAVLAVIMFGLGLSLTLRDFAVILIRPKAIITGLSTQIFIIPLIAFGIALFSGLSPEMRVGLVLVSTCASGAASNLVTHLVRGDVALAVSITTLNSIITLVTLPLIVTFALFIFMGETTRINLPIAETMLQIFLVAILPASLGVLARRISKRFATVTERPLKFILPAILFAVFGLKVFGAEDDGGSGITVAETLHIFPYVLLLNVLAMVAGYYISKMMRLSWQAQYTIAIEVGLHNTVLALLVAGTILQSHEMEQPALVYGMFTFLSAFLFVLAVKGRKVFTSDT